MRVERFLVRKILSWFELACGGDLLQTMLLDQAELGGFGFD